MKLRILLLTHNMAGLGGSFMRSFSIARELAARGHHVKLLASRRSAGLRALADRKEQVRINQPGDIFPARLRHGGLSPADTLQRAAHVLSAGVDLIHSFDHRPAVSVPAWLGQQARGIVHIADWADLWGLNGIAGQRSLAGRLTLGLADHAGERLTHRLADGVTAISSSLVREAESLGMPSERVLLLQVGANHRDMIPLPKAEMRARFGIPLDVPVLVHTGFAPYDTEFLAGTMREIWAVRPEILLLLTGTMARHLCPRLDQPDHLRRIIDFGIVSYEELAPIMACGDVMLLPYSSRALNSARYPNRLGDYLAAGRPVATNMTGDVGPLVESKGIGTAAPDRPLDFARGVLSLLDDPQSMSEMGQRARRLAETELSWEHLVAELEKFYFHVLGQGAG